jgi:PKD repeat protein
VDVGDPWGGNDGLNQAIVDPTGPVQILSPGYRNAYDLVVTESGALYVTDNGANQGWGGFPVGEGTGNVTNDYDPAEPGSQSPSGGEFINNVDHLELVTTDLQSYAFNSFYGGHPNPVRANPNGAGLFTAPGTGTAGAVFRTLIYDPDGSTPGSTTDPNLGLPANWPPVPAANPVEGDWRGPGIPNPDGPADNPVVTWGTNTNGIDEYTASNFGGAMKGNLLAGVSSGVLRRVQLNPDGSLAQFTSAFLSGIGGDALGVTCNGDSDIFPGTIWAGTLNGNLVVFEPQDFADCIDPSDPAYDPLADYDGDGYTNQDEEDNGTDSCNGGSQPSDFDKVAGAPLISDLNDTDDDADGIPDALDPFQLGDPATAGSDAFELPVRNDLFNNQQGLGGIFGLGLTGLMNNGDTGANWLLWLDRRDDPNDPNPNDVLGGAPGLMTSHMTSGTALGTTNTQEKGYQYGVQVNQNSGKFTVIGNLVNLYGPLRIYGNNAAVGGELGHFIGDGTQSNYIKVVLTADGITALQEINDVPQAPVNIPIAEADRPLTAIVFYFEVDPATGEVVLQYAKDGGARQPITTFTAQGTILTAIQQEATDLAVGFIGTSNTPGVELEGTWDFLNVIGEVPSIAQQIPDIERIVSSADEDNNLDLFFEDDNGVENLTYTIENNSNPAIGAVINGNILTLSYPAVPEITEITIGATDLDGFFVEQTFTVSVTDSLVVLYRVNTGGPALASIDGGLDWEADQPGNNSPYLVQAGTNQVFASATMPVDGSVDQATTPLEVYASERFDNTPGAPNLTYSFPVAQPGNYQIRLYMGNSFVGTSEPGERIFDVTLEGVVLPLLNDIDLSGTYGHQVGTVITHTLNVTDGAIDISFIHGAIENPLINAIEILDAPDNDTPIYVNPIADQASNSGQQLPGNLGVNAFGGDGNLQYSASGLPPGLIIEPTNGQIGGTIDAGAAAGSPYAVTITVDDSDGLSSDAVTINFSWEVFDAFAYRVNAGGGQFNSTDIASFWEDNSQSGAQQGGNYSVNTGTVISFGGIAFDQRDASIPAYIDAGTFGQLFSSERFDGAAAPDMEYSFPLDNGEYVVNLYMGNAFAGTSQPGQRIFDLLIEGAVVRDNLDLITEFGHLIGGMLSFPVTLSDGVLNIGFGREVENPTIKGIEIFQVAGGFPVLTLDPIADVQGQGGAGVNFSAVASGGDPGEPFTYYISGQPEGISIDPATGQISGTVAFEAGVGGPAGDGVHLTRVSVMKPGSAPATEVFTWTVDTDLLWFEKDEDLNYTGRHECSFVQAGDKFFLMGGRENPLTIDVYDYTTNTWNALVDSAPVEFNHFQAVEYQGLIWVIGAFSDNNFPSEQPEANIWMFDPATQEWIQAPEIPASRRRGSTGLSLYNGKFYISGGNTIGHNGGFVPWFDEFDPATGTWTPLADAPRARDHFHSVVIDDKLYLAGGRLSGGTGGVWAPTIPEVDVFDFTSGTWSSLPAGQNIPTPRGGAASVNFNGKLLVIGGEVQNESVYGVVTDDALKITEQYDPVTQSWTRLADLNFERHGTQAVVSGEGVYILAGAPNRGGGNQQNMEFLGADNPAGSPSVSSVFTGPETVVFSDGETLDIALEAVGGNVGVFVRSMTVSGPNAADFTINSGTLENAILPAGSTQVLSITLNGTGADRSAVLTIEFGAASTLNIALNNNPDLEFNVTNPGNQFNVEGDVVNLPVEASSAATLTYSATGLPPNLSINPNTGVISGTILASGGGNGAFQEAGGLLVIEAESQPLVPSYTLTTAGGETGILTGTNSFFTQNGGTIAYPIQITTPGVYRFVWNSFFSGPDSTEENDGWLRFPNNNDVWFFGFQGTPASEASLIANVQGAQNNIVFPVGSSRVTPATTPEGSSANGYFKIYKSGGASQVYEWEAFTSDNDPHNIYVWFVNPGTYTMEISERSAGHAIDRVALYKVDGPNYTGAQLDGFPESDRSGGNEGAAAGSPYTVTVSVTEDGQPPVVEEVTFTWTVGVPGELIAVPEADPVSGVAPLEVNFTGSNSLDDVGVTSYSWDFKDGSPLSTEADPVHVFTTAGDYDVELTVGDGDGNFSTNSVLITVTAPQTAPPVVDAGADQEVTLPTNSAVLPGSAVDPDGGVIVTYLWEQQSGPAPATLSGADTPTLTASDLVEGVYVFRLTATDDETEVSFDDVTVTVNPEPTVAPVVDAGADQEVTLPTNSAVLPGSATDPDGGAIVTYLWEQQTGPAPATLSGADTPTLTVSDLLEGVYVFRLTATDDDGETAFDDVTVTVNPEPTVPPVVDAGADQQLVLPENSAVLPGSATDPDGGAIVTYLWTQESGPATATLSGADTPTLTVSDLVEGVYVFRLTATDDEGETGFDEVSVSVQTEATEPPVVDAGADQQVLLPENSAVLPGSATDPDGGSIVTYLWTQQSGPSTATLSGADTPTLTASDLVEGEYVFRLTATDDEGETGFDEVTVTVQAQATEPPVVDAGADQQVVLPGNSVVLPGSATDPDGGSIVTYLWTQQSGPATATLSGADTPTLTASDLVEGVYVFRLTATDDEGETGFDEVTISVQTEATEPPVVDAGTDRQLLLPESSVVLPGSATDPDGGAIAAYQWTQESGPSTATLSGVDTPTLTASDLEEGVYVFRLTATDDEGETGFDEVSVTVTAETPSGTRRIDVLNPVRDGVARILVENLAPGVVVTNILLHDYSGRLVAEFNPSEVFESGNSYALDVNNISVGIYFLTLEFNQGDPVVLKLMMTNP